MAFPKPKHPALVIKGTTKYLMVEEGESIFSSGTRVWVMEDEVNGCLTNPELEENLCQDEEGVDVTVMINLTTFETV